MRGETIKPPPSGNRGQFQSTLPMRGETILTDDADISAGFQSTLPMRGETKTSFGDIYDVLISIHSPHAGRDYWRRWITLRENYFNPLSPCGERRGPTGNHPKKLNFNPLSPCGERLPWLCRTLRKLHISIHSPHAGRDAYRLYLAC